MSLAFLRRHSQLKKLVFRAWLWDAHQKLARIQGYLKKDDRLLDIGTGPGSLALLLRQSGFQTTTLDVQDMSLTDEIRPRLYDGDRLPFADDTFDVALILTVLHHARAPEQIILEAKRVARRIVIIEDVYDNILQRYLTYCADSLFNLDFSAHPHSNKRDGEWRKLFAALGLKLRDARCDRFLYFFKQATYYLER